MKDSQGVERMRPVIIVPRKTLSKKDIALLRDNGICVVEATDPSAVRFIDPPPQDYSAQERAAIKLFRLLMDRSYADVRRDRQEIGYLYAQLIIEGMPLSCKQVPPPKGAKK